MTKHDLLRHVIHYYSDTGQAFQEIKCRIAASGSFSAAISQSKQLLYGFWGLYHRLGAPDGL